MLRFGTDGVRGVANTELTPELVLALGRALGRVLAPTTVVVGRDTRRSGPLIEAALAAGLAAEGADVLALGVAPTPAVAWVAADRGVPAAVVSASHNPFPDNGVKAFGPDGRKLDDAAEARVEAEMRRLAADAAAAPPTRQAVEVGTLAGAADLVGSWAAAVAGSIGGRDLDGLSVVVDCANGAASAHAGPVLGSLGARVEVINASPDGTNINVDCGSTHPEGLAAAVLASGADLGLAFDGDADRCLAVDGTGRVVDGDQLIAALALDRQARGELRGGAVVVTVMANLGLRRALAERGIRVVETPVGDRHVLAALDAQDLVLGGEQSGHVIFRDLAVTGDGLLTGVQVLDLVRRAGAPLAEVVDAAMTRLPQVLRNVRVRGDGPSAVAGLADDLAAAEAELGDRGRILVRPSGTEPVVRVMVEADSESLAAALADRLAGRLDPA
ncbi:MAG: phosphoglucosamine mutase [Acidimicrobiia bacterium]